MQAKHIFADIPEAIIDEQFLTLASCANVEIERIVSTGQASPPGFWYDQEWTEWVLVLSGSAGLRFEGEEQALTLRSGDYVEIPAHARHRVEWTDATQPTVWLAVHIHADASGR
jgi:cupin 2 domain-containing protein